jgi:hypothetical protein
VSTQASLSLAAFVVSPRAGVVTAAFSILALGRYASMFSFGRSLGVSTKGAMLSAALWFGGLLGLGLGLCLVAMRAKALLPWAVGAASLGPLIFVIWTAGSGIRALGSRAGSDGDATGPVTEGGDA